MDETIRIEEKAHFLTKTKDLVDVYVAEKTKLGYEVRVEKVEPTGWVVLSNIFLTRTK